MRAPFIALFYLALLLTSPLAVALPNSPTPTSSASLPSLPEAVVEKSIPDTYTVISFQAASPTNPGVCRLSELSAEEIQRLKDSVLTSGIVGSEISSGATPNANRDKVSDRNTLLVPNPFDTETAFQKDVPTQILQPSELSTLQNQRIRGPVAFGLSLDDTLRAARCVDEASCAASGEALQYRNSGQGIVGNVKDMFSSIQGDLGKPDSVFSEEEADLIRAQIESEQVLQTEDANTFPVDTLQRVKSPDLLNHIRADNTLQAGILTNCDNGSCVLMLYSMFDKYFNSWFSGELVVGTFGPTLWGQFKKLAVNSRRFNFIKTDLLQKVPGFGTDKISSVLGKDAAGNTYLLSPSDFFKKKGLDLQEIGGADYFRNLKKTGQRDADLGDVYVKAFIDQKVTSGGGFPPLEDSLFGPNGVLTNLNDIDKRRNFFTYTTKVKEYSDVTREYVSELKRLMKGTPQERTLAARGYARIFADTDDVINLDLRATMKKLPEADFGSLIFRDPNSGLTRSIADVDDKFFNDMMNGFAETGDFSKLKLLQTEIDPATGIRGIVLYDTKGGAFIEIANLTKIQNNGYQPGALVELPGGRRVPATNDFYNEIQAASGGGTLSVFAGSTSRKVDEFGKQVYLSPQQLSEKILVGNVMPGKVDAFSRNMDSLVDTMVARDFGGGPYTNILSRTLQSKQKLVSNYFKFYTPEGGVVTTAQMYGYWFLTKGFGQDKFSIYQLPDEWTEAKFIPGEQDIYKDAYVDFFANEGSDTGDLFQQVISNSPIPWIIDSVTAEFTPLQEGWNFVNGVNARQTPDNLAIFLFGAQACANCSSVISSPNTGRFDVQYYSPESVNSFFLEHGKSKDAEEKGQLLTLYAHHTNITGKMNGADLDEINLVDARNNEETCEQVMEDLPVYGNVAKLIGAERVGAAIALTENLSYVAFGLGGALISAANQGIIAPKMGECVDDKEGYFATLYVPHDSGKELSSTNTVQKNVSQNALDGIRSFADQVKNDNPEPSLTDKVIQESTAKVQELVNDAQNLNVAEAELRVSGSSSGYLKSEEVIYFWVGGNSLIEPSRYNETGKTLITDENGNTITLDNASGTVTVNGIEVIGAESADHTRLANKNLDIPAIEIPNRVNGYTLTDTNQLLVSVNVRGESIIQDADLLDCIQAAVLAQSGVPLNSNNATEAFGKVESISTDAFPNIILDVAKNRIIMGGQSSQVANGPAASVQIYGDREVVVTGAPNPGAGKMQSVLLENGSIIYKPQTQELLIWLRHHAAAVVSDDEVQNFSGTLTTTTNENNACEEPAIHLNVETDPTTPATKLKGDNLSAGLQKNGPFQVFETDSKRFVLYSKLVDGECKQFFKVIDKETGEVYDQAIDSISQSEDGTISIKTADGLSHSLKFSDENGKPVITYDGQSEVLRSAVGKGGSFYYDPNKGLYYAENAQLIPLNDNFKNQGVGFQANPDGTVSGKSGDNVFNINTAQGGEGLFNVPSLPETLAGLLVFILVLGLICGGLYLDNRNRRAVY